MFIHCVDVACHTKFVHFIVNALCVHAEIDRSFWVARRASTGADASRGCLTGPRVSAERTLPRAQNARKWWTRAFRGRERRGGRLFPRGPQTFGGGARLRPNRPVHERGALTPRRRPGGREAGARRASKAPCSADNSPSVTNAQREPPGRSPAALAPPSAPDSAIPLPAPPAHAPRGGPVGKQRPLSRIALLPSAS